MKVLMEFVSLIKRFKAPEAHLVMLIGKKNTLIYRFYEAILRGEVKTDEEAVFFLYGINDVRYAPYKTLKTELKKRLANTTFLHNAEAEGTTELMNAVFLCQKNYITIFKLRAFSAQTAAYELAQTTLQIAIKYEQFELVTMILEQLIALQSSVLVDKPKQKRIYEEMLETYKAEVNLEREVYVAYYSLTEKFAKSQAKSEEVHSLARGYYEKFKPYLTTSNNTVTIYTIMTMNLWTYMKINKYEEALSVCNEIITFLKSRPFMYNVRLNTILSNKTICCIQLKKLEEGKESIAEALSFAYEGTRGWFQNRVLYIRLCLHTQNYQEAWEVYKSIKEHPNLISQSRPFLEEVKVVEALLFFLVEKKYIKPRLKDQKMIEKFSWFDFINDVPIYSRDHNGMQIPILLIQILWAVHSRNHKLIKPRLDTLNRFRTRISEIAADDGTLRSNYIIRMVSKFENPTISKRDLIRKTEDLLEKLKHTPSSASPQAYAIEVMPFEDLWQLYLNVL